MRLLGEENALRFGLFRVVLRGLVLPSFSEMFVKSLEIKWNQTLLALKLSVNDIASLARGGGCSAGTRGAAFIGSLVVSFLRRLQTRRIPPDGASQLRRTPAQVHPQDLWPRSRRENLPWLTYALLLITTQVTDGLVHVGGANHGLCSFAGILLCFDFSAWCRFNSLPDT